MASSAFLPSSPQRRRELSRQARDAFPQMGIYAIRNLRSGGVRVVSSRNVPAAINRTRFELQRKACRVAELQQAWDRFGPDVLAFEVLELVKQRDDPSFDYAQELDTMLQLWSAEVAAQGEPS
jgi:hypothetical protein